MVLGAALLAVVAGPGTGLHSQVQLDRAVPVRGFDVVAAAVVVRARVEGAVSQVVVAGR